MKVFIGFLLAVTAAASGFTGKQPQMASQGNTVALTFGEGNAVYYASSSDGGKTWSAPVEVTAEGTLSLGSHRGPRVVIGDGVLIVSAVAGAKGKGQDGDLETWRSVDGGKTWKAGPNVNDKAASAREGLHAMAASGSRMYAVWLDDRDGKKTLYGASSTDKGLSWKNSLLYRSPDGSVCECCRPNVMFGPDGRILAMFRNSLAGSRDLYLLTFGSGESARSARKLGDGTWKLNACPMDGGALTSDAGGIRTVWRRQDTVYEDRPGQHEKEIAKGKNPAAGAFTAWTTADGDLVAAKDGTVVRRVKGAYPALVTLANEHAVLAYESDGRVLTDILE